MKNITTLPQQFHHVITPYVTALVFRGFDRSKTPISQEIRALISDTFRNRLDIVAMPAREPQTMIRRPCVGGVLKWVALTHAACGAGAFGGAPCGATNRVRGVPKWGVEPHADAATGAFGGAPYGATKRVRGVPKCDSR